MTVINMSPQTIRRVNDLSKQFTLARAEADRLWAEALAATGPDRGTLGKQAARAEEACYVLTEEIEKVWNG